MFAENPLLRVAGTIMENLNKREGIRIMKWRLFCLIFLQLVAWIGLEATEWKILVPEDAIPAEITAAQELQAGLKKIFGKEFPVMHGEGEPPAIRVGQSPETARLLGNLDFSTLKPDEIILRTVDNILILTGDRPRGSLYAVYELLEKEYGVRFWTSRVESWPALQREFTIPQLNYRYAPPFKNREAFYDLIQMSPQFAVKLRNNGHFIPIPEAWGGHIAVWGWCHTFSHLIPPEKYFSSHPEYYSEVNGKRTAEQSQLCLTNREVRKLLAEKALEILRAHPDFRIISVSQNDNTRYCRCAKCEAFVQAHGNQSDLLIDAVNEVAAAVKKEFPEVKLETLAYQYTRKAPRTVRPLANVIVRLCSIECDFSAPLDSAHNAEFAADIRQWSQLETELYVWNYVTNFRKYYLPHPNWKCLAPDLRFFAANGVGAVFEQGSRGSCGIADFADLRVWLISKLLWDPTQNAEKLTEEFMAGYYGAAAPKMMQYLRLMTSSIRVGSKLSCYNDSPYWIDHRKMAEACSMLEAAANKVSSSSELRQRVEIAAVSAYLSYLEMEETGEEINWNAKLERQLEIARAAGVTRFSENSYQGSYNTIRKTIAFLHSFNDEPDPGVAGGRRWKSFAACDARRYGEDSLCFIEDDSSSAGGKALRMPNTHAEWASQSLLPVGNYEVYIVIRCDSERPKGNAAIAGIYDSRTCREVKTEIPAKEIAGSKYRTIKLENTGCLSANQFVFCAPVINPAVNNIWIDRYIFVEKKQP